MKKPSLLIIFLSVFIDLIGFGIVMPLLPIYSKQFGAPLMWIGMIPASFSIMQFLFAPAWGRLSDRIGRRPVLLISNAGSAVSYGLFAYASTLQGQTGLWILVASRVFAGIAGANLSVASAYIADVTTPEKRSKGMGLIGMAFGLGFVIGPALGGFAFKKFGLAGPGCVAAALCTLNFVLGCFILAESLKPGSESAAKRARWDQCMHTLRQPTVGLVIGIYFLATLCFACFETTFSLLLDGSGYSPDTITYLFTYCGILAAVLQGGLIGRLVKAMGERKLIPVSMFVTAIGLFMLPFSGSMAVLLIGLAVFAAGSGMNRPPTFGLISVLTPPTEQGAVLGVTQSAGTLARIFGPPLATTVFAYHPFTPYFFCAGLAFVTGIFAWVKLAKPAKA